MGLAQTDLDGQARVAQRVFARGARAAVIARDGDDVGARLGHARRDGAEGRIAGILTEICARGLIVFSSSTTCARSSME